MENILINPENYQFEYIKNLNLCFNGWGDDILYNWVFDRKVGKYESDILVIKSDEGEVMAGSGITYRKLIKGDDLIDIGIITGSWTLPAARRKGCLAKFVEVSANLCREKNVDYITAFMMETNPSSRRLRAAGAFMFPTFHLFSPEEKFSDPGSVSLRERKKDPELLREIYNQMVVTQADKIHFDYQLEEFRKQYIHRPKESFILQINEDFAVMEESENAVKILLLTFPDTEEFITYIKKIANWCLENRNKKIFYFTSREEIGEICTRLGFENLPGFFTILKTNGREIEYSKEFEDLWINMGDKM